MSMWLPTFVYWHCVYLSKVNWKRVNGHHQHYHSWSLLGKIVCKRFARYTLAAFSLTTIGPRSQWKRGTTYESPYSSPLSHLQSTVHKKNSAFASLFIFYCIHSSALLFSFSHPQTFLNIPKTVVRTRQICCLPFSCMFLTRVPCYHSFLLLSLFLFVF